MIKIGIGKFINPSNYRMMAQIAGISNSLERHMRKRCAYCDLDMGLGDEFPVVTFIDHLCEKHPDKIDPKDVDKYKNLINRLTR